MSIGQVFARVVPKEFRTPEHIVSRNGVYEKSANGSLRLVGQLEELGSTGSDNLAGLCGGSKRLELLNAAGSVASILNLGVSVIGFAHVSKLLHRIEDRIEGIDTKLVELAELSGVIDQKVDQLIELSEGQSEALATLHELIVSFETARVHAALETLDVLSATSRSRERDKRLIDAAETLQVFRNWLAEKRASAAEGSRAGRVELLRAEVAVVLAECRARCIADDVEFAGRVLERVLDDAQGEVERLYYWLIGHGGIHHLVLAWDEAGANLFDTDDAVEAVAWVKGVGLTTAAVDLLRDLRYSFALVELSANVASGILTSYAHADQFELEIKEINETAKEFLAGESSTTGDEGATAQPFDAASFVAAYRLMRDVESARAMCKAMEVFGEPVREMLIEEALPGSPALAIDWESDGLGPT